MRDTTGDARYGIVLPSHSCDAVTFNPTTFQVTAVNPKLGGLDGTSFVTTSLMGRHC